MIARGRILAGLAVLAVSGAAVAGCGSDDDGSDRPSDSASGTTTAAGAEDGAGAAAAKAAATVDIKNFKFLPATIAVKRGGKVTWTNDDSAPHTAENASEGGPAKFETGRLDKSDSKSVTFAKAGTYRYYCVYHRFMEADVVVK